MNLKRLVAATTLTAGVGAAGLFGIGTATADPGQLCNGPGNNCPQPGQQHNSGPQGPQHNDGPRGPQGPDPAEWQHRGFDQGRQDHRPFNWNGQQVIPMPAGNGHGWGFWFLGVWIPL